MKQLVIRGHRVILPAGAGSVCLPASIHIQAGKIASISSFDDSSDGAEVVTAGDDALVSPGLVDTHVHVNEPGRTEWEGFRTATEAGAAGGVTTIIDMPLNSIPATTSVEGLRTKLEAAAGKCAVDVGFWGGVVPGNTRELAGLVSAGVVGFKCFLIDSGVEEFPCVTEEDLRLALLELKRLNSILIVHAELPGPCGEAAKTIRERDVTEYQTFLRSRPRAAENEAIDLLIRLSREFDVGTHIVHHSSADALPAIKEAKENGVPITAETCPHYLSFVAEEIPGGATQFKCCPPIRERENRERLWDALKDGTIDMVVSDHSPCSPDLKGLERGDFVAAWGGISSLQLRLPVMWTEMSRRGFSFDRMAQWLCRAPAELAGLNRSKGALAIGHDADVVIWKENEEFEVTPEIIRHRHKLTPYNGRLLKGLVQKTFVRGQLVYDNGQIIANNCGRMLTGSRGQ